MTEKKKQNASRERTRAQTLRRRRRTHNGDSAWGAKVLLALQFLQGHYRGENISQYFPQQKPNSETPLPTPTVHEKQAHVMGRSHF